MGNDSFEWFGWMLLTFLCPSSINLKIPKEFEELYNKHLDENGNIDNIEEFINECRPYLDKFYNDLKQTINIE